MGIVEDKKALKLPKKYRYTVLCDEPLVAGRPVIFIPETLKMKGAK